MDYSGGDIWTPDVSQEKKNASFQSLSDKLQVPVTLSALHNSLSEDEEDCYRLGEFQFRTIQTVGVILEKSTEDEKTVYILHDPEETEKTISVVQLGERDTGGSKYIEPNLNEDVRVKAMGKIKNVAGEKVILCFFLQKLVDDKEYEILKLESEVARLFFQKNLIEKMRRGDTRGWDGMLAPSPHRNTYQVDEKAIMGANSVKSPSSNTKKVEAPTHSTPKNSISPKTPANAEKNKVRACILSEGRKGESGVRFERIFERVATIPENRLRDILSEMVNEGKIYSGDHDEYMTF